MLDVVFWMNVKCDNVCSIVIMNIKYYILNYLMFWMCVECDYVCSNAINIEC